MTMSELSRVAKILAKNGCDATKYVVILGKVLQCSRLDWEDLPCLREIVRCLACPPVRKGESE